MRLVERRLKTYSPLREHQGLGGRLQARAEAGELVLPCTSIRCALCCYNTSMPLSREDIERLQRAGYSLEYFAVRGEDGVYYLRNINGHCVFLDPVTGRCRVYGLRPEGCRLYPLVYDWDKGLVTVDDACPLAHLVGESVVEALAPRLIRLVEKIYGVKMRG